MDDPENENDPFIREYVVHNSVVADPKSMKGVVDAVDCLDGLALEATATGEVPREGLEPLPKANSDLRRELLVRLGCSRPQGDSIRAQVRSVRSTVLPSA